MIHRILRKISSLLLKLHLYLERRNKDKSPYVPYKLKLSQTVGSIKIIHVNGNFVIGGSTQLIVDLIERTSDKYIHKVVVPSHPEPLPYQPVDIRRFSLNEMTALYEFLRKEKPSLVHIHYWVREKHRYRDFSLWYQGVFKICEELHLKVIQNINVPTSPYHSSSVVKNIYVSEYVAG